MAKISYHQSNNMVPTNEVVFQHDHDETLTQMDLRNSAAEPHFFSSKLGKRETYTSYRGFLIVRNTVKFSHGSERRTVLYMLHRNEKGLVCSSCITPSGPLANINQAKRLADLIIETGRYWYGVGRLDVANPTPV